MPNLSTIYTGENAGVPALDFSEITKSTQSVLKNAVNDKRQDVAYARQDAKDFQELMTLDPITSISNSVMEAQVKAWKKFEEDGMARLRSGGGQMSEFDKMKTLSDKRQLQVDQAMWQADEKRLMHDLDLVSRNQEKYSLPAMIKAYNDFVNPKDGQPARYYGQGVQRAATNEVDFLKGMKQVAGWNDSESNLWTEKRELDNDGKFYTVAKVFNGNEDKAKESFTRFAFGDAGNNKKMLSEWDSLGGMKEQWLDASDKDNNGVDADERNNAIEEFAWDRYKKYFIDERGGRGGKGSSTTQSDKVAITQTDSYAVSNREGVGANKNTSFSEQSGLSGQIGENVDGVSFNHGISRATVRVPSNLILNPSKDIILSDEAVDGQILMVADGRSEWKVNVPVKKYGKPTYDRQGNLTGGWKKDDKKKNGKTMYYKIEKENRNVVTEYDPVSGVISTQFPSSRSLIADGGYGVVGNKKDGKSKQGSIFE